jgi:hypothetical protein
MNYSLLAALLLHQAHAYAESPNWYCKQVASERQGSTTINSCGIGMGKDENEARTNALDNAQKEFLKVCGLSDDCKNHKISASPERTTCEKSDRTYKCYRLIVFSIGPLAEPTEKISNSKNIDKTPIESSKNENIETIQSDKVDIKEIFTPFVYSQIKTNPKVYKGMPKAELLKQFGRPERVSEAGFRQNAYYFWYEGNMCDYGGCDVTISDGVVEKFDKFKPEFTDLLK